MWDLARVEQYIADGIEENIHLDYKGAGSISKKRDKKSEISKDVSAFANSDGGIIIYGVKEFDDLDKNHLPEKINPVDGNEYSKEWLEQIINSTISPKIHDIIITPIQIGKKEDNQVVYVVEIPKSNTAHQMNDKRYYRRYNFQSIAMEDWEIKDIINRLSKTQFKLRFETNTLKRLLKKWLTPKIEIEIWVENSGNKIIEYLDCYISGNSTTSKNISNPYVNGDFEKYFSNIVEREVTIGNDTFILNSERVVILPNTSRKIGVIEIFENFITDNNELVFQVSTEDNVQYFKYQGKEIIE